MSENVHINNFQFAASIIARSVETQAIIQAALRDIGDVKPEDVFTFSAEISNNMLDTYYTKMSLSSLKNYADDANKGVALMNSHRRNELPMGYSLRGTFEMTDGTEETARVIADFYTVRGLNLTGLSTDEFIKGIQSGIIRDVSIGFKGGDFICSICAEDMWSYRCPHIPGVTYEIVDNPDADPESQTTREEMCFAWIEDARLSEVSPVFDGATPNAMIIKAEREIQAGRLSQRTRQFLEQRYRVNFNKPIVIEAREGDENNMGEKSNSGAPEVFNNVIAELRTASRFYGFKTVQISNEDEVLAVIGEMRSEIDRLRPLEEQAREGATLRKLLVEDAVKEGVRAFGDSFDKDGQTTMLNDLPVDSIGQLRVSWKQIADSNFNSATKRTSQDDPTAKTGESESDKEDIDEDDGVLNEEEIVTE